MARDPVAEYHDSENQRRYIEHEQQWAHSEAGQYEIHYNDARAAEIYQRNEEINMRNEEIMNNLIKFYSSIKGIFILILSGVLTILLGVLKILTFSLANFFVGLIGWNVLILIILGFYFLITAKTQIKTEVRPEINDRTYFIQQSAREKAYKR